MKSMAALIFTFLVSCDASAQLRVTPFVVCSEPEKLFFVLKNTGQQDAFISERQLPWKYTSDLLSYSAFRADSSHFQPTPMASMIYDSFTESDKIRISAGKHVYGWINLHRVIGDFSELTRKSDLFLFYKSSKGYLLPAEGMVVVPKRGYFKESCPRVLQGNGNNFVP